MARPIRKMSDNGNTEKFFAHIQKRRKESLAEFRDILLQDDFKEKIPNDDQLFITTMQLAAEEYGVRFQDIAERIHYSPAAVGRWSNDVNLPPITTRLAAVAAIAEIITESLKEQRVSRPTHGLSVGRANYTPKP